MEDSYVLQLLAPKFKEFYLCFCGYAKCNPLHSFGPAVRPNYIIHYILEGKGIYQVGEQKYELSQKIFCIFIVILFCDFYRKKILSNPQNLRRYLISVRLLTVLTAVKSIFRRKGCL